jgi:hypothetical protein
MTDRDTFAAAALAGLLAQGDDGSFSEESYARAAYRWADAMLRGRGDRKERLADVPYGMTTIHDAAPAATAASADDRTDKAAPSQRRDGTGDTRLRPANVAEAWATAQQISDAQDYTRHREEFEAWKKASSSAEPAETATAEPRNGTPEEGSAQDDGSPVAWAVFCTDPGGRLFDTYDHENEAEAIAAMLQKDDGSWAAFPLYRHPQPTLADEERVAEEIEKLRPTENERAAIESLIAEEYRRGAYFWADTLKKFLERVR